MYIQGALSRKQVNSVAVGGWWVWVLLASLTNSWPKTTGDNFSRFRSNSSTVEKGQLPSCSPQHLLEGARHECCTDGRQSEHMQKNKGDLWLLRYCLAWGFQFCYNILLQICTVPPASPAGRTFLLFGVLTASILSLSRTDLKLWAHTERSPKPQIRDSAWKGVSRWCCCTPTQDFLLSSLIATLGAFMFDLDWT